MVLESWDRRLDVDKSYVSLQTVTQKNLSITKPPIICLRFCFQCPIIIIIIIMKSLRYKIQDALGNSFDTRYDYDKIKLLILSDPVYIVILHICMYM